MRPALAEAMQTDVDYIFFSRLAPARGGWRFRALPFRKISEGAPGMTDSSKTVLLVEDNEDNRTVYRTILEHYGYNVVEARNGEDGIRSAREDHPDLILMDISIPIIDGWEATKLLKADEATAHIPIIALTAHALATDRAKAEEVGCDGYLAKPCEPRRVVAEVDKFLGKTREEVKA
jgi:CheY-like chemotaxis protein